MVRYLPETTFTGFDLICMLPDLYALAR